MSQIPANPAITPASHRPAGAHATLYRTHSCNDLRKADVGKEVTLCGAVDKVFDAANVLLRDAYGMTHVKLAAPIVANNEKQFQLKALEVETIIQVKGKVAARDKADAPLATGEIRVDAAEMRFISSTAKAPLFDHHDEKLPREQRIRHRYLYLRNAQAQAHLAFRTKVGEELRKFFVDQGFDEVETPLLANKWTPEQHDAFLAIRARGEVYALPGRRPIHALALMAGGLDRTFEFSRRFQKKKHYNSWQQPEFTVLDVNMAYVEEQDLHAMTDQILFHAWQVARGEVLELPIPTFSFEEAWAKYGTDRPDTRFALEIQDLTRFAAGAASVETRDLAVRGGAMRGLLVKEGASKLSEKDKAAMANMAIDPKSCSIHWFGRSAGGAVEKLGGSFGMEVGLAEEVSKSLDQQPGDLAIVVVGKDRMQAGALAGRARLHVGQALGLAPKGKISLCRVTRLPFWRHDAAKGRWNLVGDPMTRPMPGDVDGDPYQMRQQAFYVVANGVNIGGGGVRNHDLYERQKVYGACKLGMIEVDATYGQHERIAAFGMPPCGRIAIGFERLLGILRGIETIDDFIPMPKMPDGSDPLTRSPWPIEANVVKNGLGF